MNSPGLAFHLLAKPTGAICNLDCKYCFFLSKEMLYPGDRFRMSEELLDTYIRQLLHAHPSEEVNHQPSRNTAAV
jgi:serine-type anaerobic sulfatase-maturating enzyme